jgi:hypothetical protein
MVRSFIILIFILFVTILTIGISSRVTRLGSKASESVGETKISGILSKLDSCIKTTICYRLDLTSDKQTYYIQLPKNLVSKSCKNIYLERDCSADSQLQNNESIISLKNKLDHYLGKPVEIRGVISVVGELKVLKLLDIYEMLVTGVYAQGDQKVLVILYHWKNMPDPLPFTSQEVESVIFSGPDSFTGYINEISRARTKISGKVTRWYEIETEYNPNSCSYNLDSLNENLKNDGIDKNQYNRIIYIRPFNPACGYGGSGTTGGYRTEITLDGVVNKALLAHEFGHNLSLGHANFLDCGKNEPNVYDLSNCQKVPYGDSFSPMGYAADVSYHGFHLMSLGYLESGEIKEVKTSGVYRIYRLGRQKDNQVKVVRVYKKDSNRHYYIDYRTSTGIDTNINKEGVGGVIIRISDYLQNTVYNGSMSISYLYPESFLVSSDNLVRAMKDGEIFYDKVNRIKIQQISHNNQYSDVKIDFKVDN